jgi:hypothetical protein
MRSACVTSNAVLICEKGISFMTNRNDGKTGRSRLLLKIAGVALIIVLALGATVAYFLFRSPHKSDAALISQFQSHRVVFDQLAQMAREDGVTLLWIGLEGIQGRRMKYNELPQGITQERINEYRRLMRASGVKTIYTTLALDSDVVSDVFLHSTNESYWTSDYRYAKSDKGWLWRGDNAGRSINLVTELDSLHGWERTGRGTNTGYRHLAGNWYLHYTGSNNHESDLTR